MPATSRAISAGYNLRSLTERQKRYNQLLRARSLDSKSLYKEGVISQQDYNGRYYNLRSDQARRILQNKINELKTRARQIEQSGILQEKKVSYGADQPKAQPRYAVVTPKGKIIRTSSFQGAKDLAKRRNAVVIDRRSSQANIDRTVREFNVLQKQQAVKTGILTSTANFRTGTILNEKANYYFNKYGRDSKEFKNIVREMNKIGYKPNVINIKKAQSTVRKSDTDQRLKLLKIKPDSMYLPYNASIPQFNVRQTVTLAGATSFLKPIEISKIYANIKNKSIDLNNIGLNKTSLKQAKKLLRKGKVKKAVNLIVNNSAVSVEKLKQANIKKIEGIEKKTSLLRSYFPGSKGKRAKLEATKYFRAGVVMAGIGVLRGLAGVGTAITQPVRYAKEMFKAIKTPVKTAREEGGRFLADPAGVVAEYITFAKVLGAIGKGAVNSPIGRYVNRELFILSQPKEFRTAIRKILNSAEVQRKLNMAKKPNITSADFMVIKTLNKIEAQALFKVLKKDKNSVIFGSFAQYIRSGKKTSVPKDIDLATTDIKAFAKKFIEELPKKERKGYTLKGEKLIRKDGSALFDLKPLSRLLPGTSYIQRVLGSRGRLPITKISKITLSETKRIRISKLEVKLNKAILQLERAKTSYAKKVLQKRIKNITKQIKKIDRSFKLTDYINTKRAIGVSKYTIPTSKITKISGIKFIGFGEQTVRKALGTLQVLLERNARRAKDPASLLDYLELQVKYLEEGKKIGLLGRITRKRKIRILKDTIRFLKSKDFQRLLEKRVPGLTKQYPLVAKIPLGKLRNAIRDKISKVGKFIGKKLGVNKGGIIKPVRLANIPTVAGLRDIKNKHITIFTRKEVNKLSNTARASLEKDLLKSPQPKYRTGYYTVTKGNKKSLIRILDNQKAFNAFRKKLATKYGLPRRNRLFHVSVKSKTGSPFNAVGEFTAKDIQPLSKIRGSIKTRGSIRKSKLPKDIFYHGTYIGNLKKIKKEGLKPSSVGWVDNAIFLTKSLREARRWAGKWRRGGVGEPIILKVRLTKAQLRKATLGYEETVLQGQTIKPSQIKVYSGKTTMKTKSTVKTPVSSVKRKITKAKTEPSKLTPSELSKLPKSKLSRLPPSTLSQLPASRLSKLGTSKLSRLPASRLSKLPPSVLSQLPASALSKLPASKIPFSKLPPSVLSKLPASTLSKLPASTLSKLPPSTFKSILPRVRIKLPPIPKKFRRRARTRKEKKAIEDWIKRQPKVYRPSLVAVLFDITGYKVPKNVTGFEIRPVIVNK